MTAALAINLPHYVLTYRIGRGIARLGETPCIKMVKDGLVPDRVGLILASAAVMARAADKGVLTVIILLGRHAGLIP